MPPTLWLSNRKFYWPYHAHYVLAFLACSTIWFPNVACYLSLRFSLQHFVSKSGVRLSKQGFTQSLRVKTPLELWTNDWLLYCHFGVLQKIRHSLYVVDSPTRLQLSRCSPPLLRCTGLKNVDWATFTVGQWAISNSVVCCCLFFYSKTVKPWLTEVGVVFHVSSSCRTFSS